MNELVPLYEEAFALKMYLNQTFSTLQLDDMSVWTQHLESWPCNKPLCVHAEKHTMGAVILLAELTSRPVHICHVSTKQEVMYRYIQFNLFDHFNLILGLNLDFDSLYLSELINCDEFL